MSVTTPDDLDWYAWHAPYDELVSPLTQRLARVQDHVRTFLDTAPAGPLRVVSLAAGQSRDLLPLLIEHPRGQDVQARLVELDARNADFAEGAALSARLFQVEIVVGDAGLTDVFAGAVPAHLVLACGLFDTIDQAGIATTVAALPQLCAPDATVIWTGDPTTTPLVQALLGPAGLTDEGVEETAGTTVGVARLTGPAAALTPGRRMFTLH